MIRVTVIRYPEFKVDLIVDALLHTRGPHFSYIFERCDLLLKCSLEKSLRKKKFFFRVCSSQFNGAMGNIIFVSEKKKKSKTWKFSKKQRKKGKLEKLEIVETPASLIFKSSIKENRSKRLFLFFFILSLL